MLELYVIRHGLAGKPFEVSLDDDERPLTKKGKKHMKDVAKALKDLQVEFDQVLTSPLLRAKETAEIINEYCGETKKVTITNLLKPGASYDKLIKYLNELKDTKRVAIVGHEPFLSGFATYCLTKTMDSWLKLKKGGVILLEVEGMIKPGQCVLACLMEPRHLGCK